MRNSHTNPPADLYESKEFREGFARLSELGLSFEAWQYHPQMPAVTALAKAFPDTTIILNHFGGPLGIGPYEGRRAEIFGEWKTNIAELARCPERRGQARRNQHAGQRLRMASEAVAADLG